jgi:uncharacterized protein (TIGR03435 family)
MSAYGVRMMDEISGLPGPLIVNETGLTGKYHIGLHWTPDDLAGTPSGDMGPSISTALEGQLRLKFESQKAPLDSVVVDHVEHPSAN